MILPGGFSAWETVGVARLKDIVVDCRHPASLARFWAAAVNGYAVAPYDEDELARLRGMGIHDPGDDPLVVVEGPASAPRLLFQQVPEAKRVKNRVHLDLEDADLEEETRRLVDLGAGLDATYPDHRVMVDPEGNEFCLGRP